MQMPRLLVPAVSLVLTSVGAMSTSLAAQDAVDAAKYKRKRVNQVTAGILANNKRLGTVRLDLRVVFEDLTVSKREDKTISLGGGATAIVSKIPYSASLARATIHDKSLRYDYLDDSGGVKKSWLTQGDGIWQEISSSHPRKSERDRVVRRRTDQMPGIPPLDPRDACALELSRGILDICKDCEVVSIQDTEAGVRVAFAYSGTSQLEIVFSPRFGYMPVQSTMRFEGLIGGITEASYREIPGGGWVLNKATTRYYSDRVAVPNENVSQRRTLTVTHLDGLTAQERDEAFQPRELKTLRLEDHTKRANER